jgi:hypothetical protein
MEATLYSASGQKLGITDALEIADEGPPEMNEYILFFMISMCWFWEEEEIEAAEL